MGLVDFEGRKREELSLIRVTHTILEGHGKRMAFADIINVAQEYLGTSDEEIRERLPQFYADIDTDSEFISMGGDVWALRSWFPYESVDEEVNHPKNEDDEPRKKHHRKVNAFITSSNDDDIIDRDSDDPKDDDLDTEDDDNADDFDAIDDDDFDDADDDDELPDDTGGQLSELNGKGDEDDE